MTVRMTDRMTVRAIMRRWPAGAFMLAALLMFQPLPVAAQTDAAAQREVRVLETVEPSTGRRSLHVMEGLAPDEIRAVQRALSGAGFGEPWREGTLDPFTRGALQRFQTHRGLTVCACVSLETLIELDLQVRVAETIVLEEPRRPEMEEAFSRMGGPPKSEVLMIGDSLSSDIAGGVNFGIDTCWFNPKGLDLDGGPKPTFTIADLTEIDEIVDGFERLPEPTI